MPPTKGIDLGLNAQSGVQMVGDPDAIATLLSNLVDNALRYTPNGGRVDVGIALDSGRPIFSVRDSGPGIPESDRERVFDRFVRGSVTAGTARGSGLGLSIVKRIAERHGADDRRRAGPGRRRSGYQRALSCVASRTGSGPVELPCPREDASPHAGSAP